MGAHMNRAEIAVLNLPPVIVEALANKARGLRTRGGARVSRRPVAGASVALPYFCPSNLNDKLMNRKNPPIVIPSGFVQGFA